MDMRRLEGLRRAALAAATLVCLAALLPATAPLAAAHGGVPDVFQASGAVYDVTWNKQGTMFATATDTGVIALYDGVYHVPIRNWTAQAGPINEVAFSPDGSKIASGSGAYLCKTLEQTLKVFSIEGQLLLNITDIFDWVTSVQWSPDGAFIASGSGRDDHIDTGNIYGEVKFWNASTGALFWNATPPNASYPARMAWAPDGHALATVGHLNDIYLYDPYATPPSYELINHSYRDPVGHASHGWAISWSPNSKYIVGGFSYDWTRPSAQTPDFNPDGQTDVGPVIVFDPDHRDADGFAEQLLRGEVHGRPAEWVSWDSTGTFIASCSGVDLVDARGPQAIAGQDGIVDAGELVVWNFSASHDGRLAAVNVWIFGTSWCSSNAFRPGNNITLAAANADGKVKLYIFDEDGDGYMIWEDDAPLDPAVHRILPARVPDLLEQWGLLILLVLVAGVAVIVYAAFSRTRVSAEPEPRRKSPKSHESGRSSGRARSARRR
jgi:WD40 repeat protein